MTPAEAAALLAVAAAFDNRKPDADAAKAWALALDDLRFEDCRQAVVDHYRVSTDWLMPAKVRAEVKRIRDGRLRDRPLPPVPAGLTDAAELAWKREMQDRIADGEVFPVVELTAGTPPAEVRALAAGWRAER